MNKKLTQRICSCGMVLMRNETTPQIYLHVKLKYNQWEIPSGKVDPGETSKDAAIRELYEEAGIRVEERNGIYLGYLENTPKYHCSLFAWELPKGEIPKHTEPTKHSAGMWFDLDNLPTELTKYTTGAERHGYFRMARDRLFGG